VIVKSMADALPNVAGFNAQPSELSAQYSSGLA
jgi:hypothetical protein